MSYVLGADGGGTKTDMFVFTTDGFLAARATGEATNHEIYSGGFDEMTPVFEGIQNRALSLASIGREDLSAAVYGMAGIDIPPQKDRMESYLDGLGIKNHKVMNDSFLGIKAACRRGYGVSFVNGTGNSVGGIDRHGNWLQVGGTGEEFGDLNGAYGMTKAVIRAVYSMFYRCGEKTSMAEKFFSLLGISDPAKFTEAIYAVRESGALSNRDIHNSVLYAAANEGDGAALALLRSFGEQFAASIGGCISNLSFEEDEVEIVCIGSGTLKARSPVMMDRCAERIFELTGKRAELIPLSVPPAAGAVLWAIELAAGAEQAAAVHDRVISELKSSGL